MLEVKKDSFQKTCGAFKTGTALERHCDNPSNSCFKDFDSIDMTSLMSRMTSEPAAQVKTSPCVFLHNSSIFSEPTLALLALSTQKKKDSDLRLCTSDLGSLLGVDLLAVLVESHPWGRGTVAATFPRANTVEVLVGLFVFGSVLLLFHVS